MAGFPRLSARNGAFFLFFLLQFLFTLAQDEPQCSATKPCAKGCCSKWGFCGYGKDSCAKDVCVNNCDQKAECDPGGFGREFVQIDKCPLNVCCSKSGFCGYTEEFCGQNKIDPPKCSSHTLQRVVGYYEGWSKGRVCNKFMPEQIPLGVYTHLNYAFATIDPETFQVRLASSTEKDIYERLTMLKERDPDLKVLIAIGGWTFNDPGPTETTFSDIARSESNQKAFIKSLVSFLSTYNFDGIDLDWEYPKAKDRSGRDEDFETFPKFLANIKSALKSTGRDELSITLPASYWYLQNFDLGKIEPHVDFFNIMSYDLHGTWDKGNEWVGPYLNAHTNLTEIKEAMNLLWRNKVSPDKVVLGTGFYGRAFTATSPNCLEPGCTYESGAPRQKCSNEISVMLNSEIMEVINRTNASPKLDKEAAVKILTFDSNNWVAYDDEETLKMKADFAREQCLSGLMVWAVSHDVEDGRFSKAIGEAAGRKFTSIPIRGGMTMIEIDSSTSNQTETKHAQCKWTDCGQSCPANWIRVMRKDKGARKNEQMIDGTGCVDGAVHELCCPPEGDMPTCGWYTHNNGKCDQKCPEGTFEIGSLNSHCRSNYQSACCTKGSSNTKLYESCSWTDGPKCDDYDCASGLDKVAVSGSGSGGAGCDSRHVDIPVGEYVSQERKYCCKKEDENHKWDDCQVYNNLGPGPSDDEFFCRSGCPSDRVRVALNRFPPRSDNKIPCFRGLKAHCCIPKSSTFTKRESPLDSGLRDVLDTFAESPFCYTSGAWMDTGAAGTAGTGASKRSDSGSHHEHHHRHQHSHTHHPHTKRTLQRRDAALDTIWIKELVRAMLKSTATTNQKAIWDDTIGKKYPNLVWSKLGAYVTKTNKLTTWGVNQLSDLIVCNLSQWNRWVGNDKEDSCSCDTAYCCPGGGTECGSEEVEPLLDRRSFTPREDFYLDENGELDLNDLDERANWRRPGEPRPYNITFPDGTRLTIYSEEYVPKGTRWPANHPIWSLAWMPPDGSAGCNTAVPIRGSTSAGVVGTNIEHIIELNTIARFFTSAMSGYLPSGRRYRNGPVSTSLVRETLLSPYYEHMVLEPWDNGWNTNEPVRRIFTSLGSINNGAPFVLLNAGLNQVKSVAWTQRISNFASQLSPNNMQNMMKEFFDSDFKPPERLPVNHAFLQALRGMVQSMNYIRDPEVWGRLVAINRNLRREFLILERAHFQNTGIRDHVVDAWDEFIRDELQLTLRYAQSFVTDWSNAGMNLYQPYSTNQLVAELVQTMLSLLGDSNDLDFDLDTLKGPRDPQNPDAPEDSEGLDGLEKLEDLSLE